MQDISRGGKCIISGNLFDIPAQTKGLLRVDMEITDWMYYDFAVYKTSFMYNDILKFPLLGERK